MSIGRASARWGKLYRLWGDNALKLCDKLRLFESAVVSVLVYGCEAWPLDAKTVATLTSWCARRVSILSGLSIRDECVHPSYKLVDKIRARRLRYVGHVLRSDDGLLMRRALLGYCGQALARGGLRRARS